MRYQAEAMLALRSGACDALITVGRFEDERCDTLAVGKVSTAAFFSKSHPLASKKTVTICELSAYPVMNAPAISDFSDAVTGAYRRAGLTSPEIMVPTDEGYRRAAVEQNAYSLGLAVSAFGIPGFAEMHAVDPAEVVTVPICRMVLKGAASPGLEKLDRFFSGKSFNLQRLFGA